MEVRKGLNALQYFDQDIESVGVGIQDQITEKMPTPMRAAFGTFCICFCSRDVDKLDLLELMELLELLEFL